MLKTTLTLLETATTDYDADKCLSTIKSGKQPVDQIKELDNSPIQTQPGKTQKHSDNQVAQASSTESVEPALKQGEFEFEIVTVNSNGKIIHRETKQGRYETEDLGNGVTLDMVYIPGGTFMMGSPEDEKGKQVWLTGSESPQHEVTIEPFWMAKYLVTQAQWQAVMGNNPSRFKGDNRPVEKVSWDDSVKFCQRLSEITGKHYHLPSEAQWEYAGRAGTTTPFYFGPTITTDLANYDGNYSYGAAPKCVFRRKTTEVGCFPPNAFGLYDMHGNLWEWCADPWHDNYKGAPTDGRVWEIEKKVEKKGILAKLFGKKTENKEGLFTMRSGSWYGDAWWARSAYRFRSLPTVRCDEFGVRPARMP